MVAKSSPYPSTGASRLVGTIWVETIRPKRGKTIIKTLLVASILIIFAGSAVLADDDDDAPSTQITPGQQTSQSRFTQPIEDFFIAESLRVEEANELQSTIEIESENGDDAPQVIIKLTTDY
jgi:hypothetical protein